MKEESGKPKNPLGGSIKPTNNWLGLGSKTGNLANPFIKKTSEI